MSNAFYRFLNRFITRSTVKAEPINAQFDAVEDGFDTVDGQLSRAVKITGLTNGGEVAKTPSTFLQLDASGNPTASATVPFSPNFSGNRLQSVGTGTSGTDAPNLNQVQQLISEAAFGSPEVIAMPSLVGNALKQWRVKADETGTEFAFALPQSTNTGEQLVTVAGTPTWKLPGNNLLLFSSMDWGELGWTKGSSAVQISSESAYSQMSGVWDVGTITSGLEIVKVADAYAPRATVGASYTASVHFLCVGTAQNKVQLFVRFLDASYVALGSDTTTNVSASNDGVLRGYSVTAVAPGSAAYVVCGLKSTASITLGNNLYATRFQIEASSSPSAWMDTRSFSYLADYTANVQHTESLGNVTVGIGIGFGTGKLAFRTNSSSVSTETVSATVRAENVTAGNGTIDLACKRAIFSKTLGFASVYDNGNTGASQTVNWYNGQKQKSAITANTTITLTAPDSDIVLDGLRWRGTFSGAGGWTLAFTSAATINWAGGILPTSANGMLTTTGKVIEVLADWDGSQFVLRWSNLY